MKKAQLIRVRFVQAMVLACSLSAASLAQAQEPATVSCATLKQAIADKLASKGVKNYQLEIINSDDASSAKIVGSCDAGKHKITYTRDSGAH